MSNKEFEKYIQSLDNGLELAEKDMLREKAARGASVVYANEDGQVYYAPAEEIIASHPQFQQTTL